MSCDMNNDMCCCENMLDLDKLCAKCAKICWLKAKKIWVDHEVVNDLCAQQAEIGALSVVNEVANSICSQAVVASNLNADSATVNNLCAQSANMNDLCVNNLRVQNFQNCNIFRATAVLSANLTYTLGTDVLWNTVLDDPNSNFNTATGAYTAPKSGYYNHTIQIDSSNLQGSAVIAGIPVASVEVWVNGVFFRRVLSPLLSFSTSQSAFYSSLILLNSGDVVTSRANILVLDPVLGLMNYVGTSTLQGNGTFPNNSSFGIILISELCTSSPGVMCTPCQPVTVSCQPFTLPCSPVVPLDCGSDDQPMPNPACVPCQPMAPVAPVKPAAPAAQAPVAPAPAPAAKPAAPSSAAAAIFRRK